jgi:hypothetical protein
MLSDMAAKGNAMAHLREKELTLLQKMKEAVIGRETGRPGRPDLTPYPSSTKWAIAFPFAAISLNIRLTFVT